MSIKKTGLRVSLNRETVRRLTRSDLAGVVGGSDAATGTQTVASGVTMPPGCPLARTLHTCPVG